MPHEQITVVSHCMKEVTLIPKNIHQKICITPFVTVPPCEEWKKNPFQGPMIICTHLQHRVRARCRQRRESLRPEITQRLA